MDTPLFKEQGYLFFAEFWQHDEGALKEPAWQPKMEMSELGSTLSVPYSDIPASLRTGLTEVSRPMSHAGRC
jgi:hypothetical protein